VAAEATARSAEWICNWRGTGSLVTGISGAGLPKTSRCAVSSSDSAAARLMARLDRG